MINFFNLSPKELNALFDEIGETRYRATQFIQWMHKHRVLDIDQMTSLGKNLRDKLKNRGEIRLPRTAFESEATDGTCKWLFELEGGSKIETVFIPSPDRGTLCISSQVGCALNCSFCSTGKQGFNRNLNFGEIIAQLWIASGKYKVTNVVMMGMGEPLLNYDPVVAAVNLMMSDTAFGLSKYRVTISTSGVLPAMRQLKKDTPAALAVSLHAPTDELRNQLVPLNKKYPLKELMEVCRAYFQGEKKRMITFEYVMLEGINDSLTQAKQVVQLLAGMPCKMNLIPFNPFPNTNYKTSSAETISAFQEYLMAAGVPTWVRRTRGDEIAAACGQLAGKFYDRTGRHEKWLVTTKVSYKDTSIMVE